MNPRLVLGEMIKREDWMEFSKTIGFWSVGLRPMKERFFFIRCDLILNTTGKLADLAIEFLRGRNDV